MKRLIAALAFAAALSPAAFAEACPADGGLLSYSALTCQCAPFDINQFIIYGTDRYTADSHICMAAVHAGLITAEQGGEITVYGGDGCTRYTASYRNGVGSIAWGPFSQSFWFTGYTPPDCPASGRF